MVALPAGDALAPADSYRFARAGRAPLVLLAGAVRSGKTTLIASLHDRFLAGPFAGYWFAGSETLRAFEERCFDARVASRNAAPGTVRTSRLAGLRLYHLRLRSGNQRGPVRNLLVLDRSGEFFGDVLDSRQEMEALEIGRRADQFVLLVSGPMLFSGEVQAKIRSNTSMLIRRCVEEGVLGSDSRVDVLVTKWDVVSTLFPGTAEAVLARFSEYVTGLHGTKLRRLRISPIAARPHPGSPMPAPWGIEDLLRSWVEEVPVALDRKPVGGPWPGDPTDMFDVYALRHAPDAFDVGL
jgi:hypothetical protein